MRSRPPSQGPKPGTFEPVDRIYSVAALSILPRGRLERRHRDGACVWPKACWSADDFDPRDQVDRLPGGSRRAIFPRRASASASPRAPRGRLPQRAVAAPDLLRARTIPKQLDPEVLSRVAPAVMFGFGSIEAMRPLACEAARTPARLRARWRPAGLLAACSMPRSRARPRRGVLQTSPDRLARHAAIFARKVAALRAAGNRAHADGAVARCRRGARGGALGFRDHRRTFATVRCGPRISAATGTWWQPLTASWPGHTTESRRFPRTGATSPRCQLASLIDGFCRPAGLAFAPMVRKKRRRRLCR